MSHEGPLTVITVGTTIRGDIQSEDDLTIEGRVEGSVAALGVVTITETGEVVSNVSASDVIVLGALAGDIHATSSVEIAAGGRVEGDIKAARVILSEGAIFRGSIDMGGEGERPRKATTPQRNVSRAPAPVEPAKHPFVERQTDRYAATERPRRSAPPQAPSALHQSAAIPAYIPQQPRQVAPVKEAPTALRAPDPRVRGVGRTHAFKK